jgi:hypothetical protein
LNSEPEVLVKATPLRAVLGFMHENLSEQGRARVISRIETEFPDQAKRLGAQIIASDRFPIAFVNRLIDLSAQELGRPAVSVAHAIGRRGAEEASSGLLRLAMIMISIPNLLRKLAPVWSQLYSHGTMRHAIEPNHAVMELLDFPVVSATGCARITGWFEWFAQKAEKTAVVSHSSCRAGGARLCQWDLRW